jgi:molybdopterin converting factor small subunit
MKVCFRRPFDELAGMKETNLEIDESVQLKDVLKLLAAKAPGLRQYLCEETDEVLNFSILFVCGDKILRLEDRIQNKDKILLLPPISGG